MSLYVRIICYSHVFFQVGFNFSMQSAHNVYIAGSYVTLLSCTEEISQIKDFF